MNRNQIERKQCMDRIDDSITNVDDSLVVCSRCGQFRQKVTCEHVVGSGGPVRISEFRWFQLRTMVSD